MTYSDTYYMIRNKRTNMIRTYDNFESPRPPVLYPSIEAAKRWLAEERRRTNRWYKSGNWIPPDLRPFDVSEWEIIEIKMLEMKWIPAKE